jgi:release factor glutamine methyltransferase
MRFIEADLFPPVLPDDGAPFDVVVANLPYVRSDEVDALQRARLSPAFEPRRALDGGADGLAVIGRLLEQLPDALASDGVALLEIGADQGESIVALAAERLPGWSCTVIPDLAGLPRIARLASAATADGRPA